MEAKKIIKCSLCGETDHNKRTCPQKPIEDTFIREGDYVEESIEINLKKTLFIQDLLDREAYDIETDIFEVWLHNNRPCKLKEVRYVMDKGLNKDTVILYIRSVKDINIYY